MVDIQVPIKSIFHEREHDYIKRQKLTWKYGPKNNEEWLFRVMQWFWFQRSRVAFIYSPSVSHQFRNCFEWSNKCVCLEFLDKTIYNCHSLATKYFHFEKKFVRISFSTVNLQISSLKRNESLRMFNEKINWINQTVLFVLLNFNKMP